MKRKIFLIFFSFILVSSCGYKNLYLETSKNFKINKISTSGENRIGYEIEKFLKLNSSLDSSSKYDVMLDLKKIKSIKEKNISGRVTKYNLELKVSMTLNDSKNLKKISKNFSQAVDYSVEKNHSDTKTNEKISTKNLTELVQSDILNFIILYNDQK